MDRYRVGYARVSTQQASQERSLEDHQPALLRKAGCLEVYREQASGAKAHVNPGLQQCIDHARQHVPSEIVVTNLDRLGRTGAALIELIRELRDEDITVFDLHDGQVVEVSLLNKVKALLGEEERNHAIRRATQSLKARQAQGIPIGRAPIGYRRNPGTRKFEKDLATWDICEQAIRYYAERGTLDKLRLMLAEHGIQRTRESIRRWLNNPVLRGHIHYKDGTELRNQHPALIEPALYVAIKNRMAVNDRLWGVNSEPLQVYAVTNEVTRCLGCGKTMHSSLDRPTMKRPERLRRFRCRTPLCDGRGKSILDSEVEREIIAAWANQPPLLIPTLEVLAPGAPLEPPPNLPKLEAELKSYKDFLKTSEGDRRRTILQWIQELELKIENGERLAAEWAEIKASKCEPLLPHLLSFPEEMRRQLYLKAQTKVTIFRGVVMHTEFAFGEPKLQVLQFRS